MVIIQSRLVLRGWIHLCSHYGRMLHDLSSSPQPFRLLLFLSRKVPHIKPRGLLGAQQLFLVRATALSVLNARQEIRQVVEARGEPIYVGTQT